MFEDFYYLFHENIPTHITDSSNDQHTVKELAAPAGLPLFGCGLRDCGLLGGLSGVRFPPRSGSYGRSRREKRK